MCPIIIMDFKCFLGVVHAHADGGCNPNLFRTTYYNLFSVLQVITLTLVFRPLPKASSLQGLLIDLAVHPELLVS